MSLEWLGEEMNRQTQRVTERLMYGPGGFDHSIVIRKVYGVVGDELVQEPCGCWYQKAERFKVCEQHR